jgi:hypothetical protein
VRQPPSEGTTMSKRGVLAFLLPLLVAALALAEQLR